MREGSEGSIVNNGVSGDVRKGIRLQGVSTCIRGVFFEFSL